MSACVQTTADFFLFETEGPSALNRLGIVVTNFSLVVLTSSLFLHIFTFDNDNCIKKKNIPKDPPAPPV